ncbi:MAG: response regulator [Candidatus Scalindua sp.]
MEQILEERRKDYQQEINIIIAEDDEGHATLIMKNLKRAGFRNNFLHFKDGQEVLDFLFESGEGPHRISGKSYLLLLDIRMPKVDGVEVLRQIKEDPELSKMPVIMVTTTDDPREIENCHNLGCNVYITKPVDYEHFTDAIKTLGLFLKVVRVPKINGDTELNDGK